jgi:N-acetylmuramoyl-L-alanine amidase
MSSQRRTNQQNTLSIRILRSVRTRPRLPPITINQTILIPPPKPIAAVLLALLTSLPALAQQPAPQPRTVILLDPAHGGPDPGAHLADGAVEKDLTLAFANRLRTLLTANGFTLISTRDSDPAVPFPTDQRAEIANHARPAACLILHATASGSGVHIVTSALAPPADDISPHAPIPWNTAQAASIPQSLTLANDIAIALLHARLPSTLSRASVRPLDNLLCPAVILEIAPLTSADSDPTPVTDANYQQRIAQAISSALASWRTHNAAAASGAAR